MSPSRETMLRARQDYVGGAKVATICARYRLSNARLYLWLDGGPEDDNGERLPPIPRRARSAPKRRTTDPRAALVARLWRTADRQVREIEARIGRGEQEPAERERDARVMAVTVKTLREFVALDDAKSGEAAAKGAARDDDEPPFRDVDELRRELARRVDLLRQRRAADDSPGAGEPEASA